MNRIFFIPGVGANDLAFSRIGDVGIEKIAVQWIPNLPDDSLESYGSRLIQTYGIKPDDLVGGLSFGGLLAQSIAKLLNMQKVILISSFRDCNDLRFPFRLSLNLKLGEVFPQKRMAILENWMANLLNSGTQASTAVLKEMMQVADYPFMKWSIKAIGDASLHVKDDALLYNIIGTQDRVVKTWLNDTTYLIQGGGHFMVYDKADEITCIIRKIISSG